MTDVKIGYGVAFARGDGASPEVFTALAEITNITPPQLSRDTVDATHQGSPDGYREFIGGLRDSGEVSLEMNWIAGSTTDTTLLTDFDSDDPVNYRITFNDADTTTATFAGFVTGYTPNSPMEDKQSASVTIKVTGKVTWA